VFPLGPAATFDDKQGRVHACVAVDFVSEFGCYLEVPLPPPRKGPLEALLP
jgi:ureidoglycolate lyase